MENTVSILLVGLSCTAGYLYSTNSKQQQKAEKATDPKLTRLRRLYLTANLLALAADWLQGPYNHRLYAYYGHSEGNIALLFLAGYVSSCTFGSVVGPLADIFGRKRMAQVFCTVYGVCCLTKLSQRFGVLMTGRILSGVSTSCLYSVFESWYVAEHNINNFDKDEIGNTLSLLSLFNSLLAITAGVVADFLVRDLLLAPWAPFLLAVPLLMTSFLIIGCFWQENYGDKRKNLMQTYKKGLLTIINDKEIMKLGALQALVESSMFTFVYLWTPTLTATTQTSYPLGRVFSCFMVSIMVGSLLFRMLIGAGIKVDRVLAMATNLFLVSNLCAAFTANSDWKVMCLLSFIGIEISLGLYFPAIGTIRSNLIPETERSTVINLFRIPLNLLTVGALSLIKFGVTSDRQVVFGLTSLLLAVASNLAGRFQHRAVTNPVLAVKDL